MGGVGCGVEEFSRRDAEPRRGGFEGWKFRAGAHAEVRRGRERGEGARPIGKRPSRAKRVPREAESAEEWGLGVDEVVNVPSVL